MAAYQKDPEAVKTDTGLTDQEKEALRLGDKDKLTANSRRYKNS